jgi:argininosuccinate lyase
MKLWSGRFSKEISGFADMWAASIEFDKVLYKEDITGSLAHCKMLAKMDIIPANDAELIQAGLHEILDELEEGSLEFPEGTEDIHMGIEALLTEKIGEAGKKLHTARSRNDQVATDLRLFVKEDILSAVELLKALSDTLLASAGEHTTTIMPGYTHLQHAQPVSLGFHLMAYRNMFERDIARFWDSYKRTDYLPLGSGALAGTSYDTDRKFLADELEFGGLCANAMDAVSDRDFVIEYISVASIAMMHLSRFCEELILWSSSEFAFIEIDDTYSTGSSIMPQKKNPDMAELIRGKTGRVYGDLMAILTIMKGLPLAYNKDMQEDKLPLFDASETLKSSLIVFTDMLRTISINVETMAIAATKGFMNATDAADYLVRKGVPFRTSHEIIGKIVAACIEEGVSIEDFSLEELNKFSDKFEADIYDFITPIACMNAKRSEGGTAEFRVKEQLTCAKT